MTYDLLCFSFGSSEPGHQPTPTSGPGPQPPKPGKQTGNKKGLNAAVWAVPVAIVGLLIIVGLVYFARKSRRLERSMFALMTRRTIDDDGGVTFHSGIDLFVLESVCMTDFFYLPDRI